MTSEAILYIQIPFVGRRQAWSQRHQVVGWDSARNKRYAEAIVAEIEANAGEFSDIDIAAVRIGGGRASQIGGEAMWSIVRALRSRYRITKDTPVSLRCALADISGASMPYFRRSGISRFDMEMLALSSTSFARMNDVDNISFYPIACNAFLHSEQNDSLGLMLLAGSPKASDIEVRRTFLEARYYNSARIYIERYAGPDADEARTQAQIDDARTVLEQAGFAEYAPDRFARPGCEDPFFKLLYAGADVIGLGLGAQTRLDGALSTNTTDLDVYLAQSGDFTKVTAAVQPAGDKIPCCC